MSEARPAQGFPDVPSSPLESGLEPNREAPRGPEGPSGDVSTPPKRPRTRPCERCVRGSVEGPNGEWWRCAYCAGTGRVVA